MKFNDLVGFQLVYLNDDVMIVKKEDKTYVLEFDYDYGDCCGYAHIKNSLLINENETTCNPIITKIEDKVGGNGQDRANILITLFGGHKLIAEIEAEAGSGSGWSYGAVVTVKCKPLEIDEKIVSW